MQMKISRYDNSRVDKPHRQTPPVKRHKLWASKSRSPNVDKVSISSRAAEVQKYTEIAKSASDMRQDRIGALKRQIEAGTYKVSGESVAESIIKLHKEIEHKEKS